MRVVITGGGGFIGRKLATALLARGRLAAADGEEHSIERLVLLDQALPATPLPDDPRLEVVLGDLRAPDWLERILTPDTAVVFHLAAVVSAGAEEDFDLGMAVNLHATMALLEACRRLPRPPRLVFASSVAVFGGAMPPVIEDMTAPTPTTSYGTQKAIGELLVNDYSRKGFIDGRVLRLPTIVVRPGSPNKAASGFASSIIREPLLGKEAVCPVDASTEMWLLSPRRAVAGLLHAAALPAEAWGPSRILALPGLTATVAQMLEALDRVAGQGISRRVHFERDPFVAGIVAGWATRFDPQKALALGFAADENLESIVQGFIEDELEGRIAA
jgi:nucleoside-diphosphate-sugar epimerase